MRDLLKDRRLSRSETLELSVTGGPKTSQKRRVSSAPADTTVDPSGLCENEQNEMRFDHFGDIPYLALNLSSNLGEVKDSG